MARKQSLTSRLSLFLLLAPSCAWATYHEATTHGEVLGVQDGGNPGFLGEEQSARLWKRVEAEVIHVVEEQISLIIAMADSTQLNHHRQQQHRDLIPGASVAFTQPQITPPPALSIYKRQNDAQIAQLSAQIESVSQASRQVSQASQQVSQSSQQLSNSLQQVQQQLSQTAQSLASARASADASRQSAEAANQASDQASRDADQARQSADRAVALASSNAASSAASSVGSVIAAMSQSAQAVMSSAASLVQAARADVTAVRTDADKRVLQAQGAAVSVTQAALAIVGAIIGSSLLTVAAFVFVLRLKRRRHDRRSIAVAVRGTTAADDIGYLAEKSPFPPAKRTTNFGYPVDIKRPEPAATAAVAAASVPRPTMTAKVSYPAQRKSFHLRNPPKGKFTLFPKNATEAQLQGQGQRAARRGPGDEVMGVATSSPTSDYGVETEKARVRGSTAVDSPPSLEKWMRMGTDVSPFGTLVKNGASGAVIRKGNGNGDGNASGNGNSVERKRNWPLDRKVG